MFLDQTIYVLACVVAGSENLRRWVVGNEILIGALKAAIVRLLLYLPVPTSGLTATQLLSF